MPAGLNRVCRIIRFSYPQDDSVGGAVPSGTVLYENIDIRIASQRPTMALLEQGLSTPALYSAYLFEGNISLEHNDQIHFKLPVSDWYFDKKFRIIGVQRSSNHPAQDRNQVKVTLKRWEESHSNDLQ